MKQYKNADDCRIAILARLNTIAKTKNIDITRLQRQLAYDRFLNRIFADELENFTLILKGGHALEMRFQNTRATVDLDLCLKTSIEQKLPEIIQILREKLKRDLHDYFSFSISEPIMDITAAPYGGARFLVETKLAGKRFISFHLDIGVGDFILMPIDYIFNKNLIDCSDVEAIKIPTISKEQHFAEKIHAYTLPRENPNSRCKDLIDLIILIDEGSMNAELLRKAIDGTFHRRSTHKIPTQLDPPPHFWEKPFNEMARSCNIKLTINEAFHKLEHFMKTF